MTPRRRALGVWLFCTAVAALVLGPMLKPGFPLRFDLVSVPAQAFGRDTWGLGDGLPRAVPLDAVTALLARVLPDSWLAQLLALAALVLAGTGAARLTAAAEVGLPGQLLAGFVAIWNPFVLEQLAIGHVPHLLAYGTLPWIGLAAYRVARSPSAPAWAGTALLVALGSVTPGGGLLCVLACLAGLFAGSGLRPAGWSIGTALTAVALQAPWVLTGIGATRSGQAATGTATGTGNDVFALRSETGWGRVLDALGQGGMWNASALPESRFTVLAKLSCVLFVLLGLAGLAVLARPVTRERVPGRVVPAGGAVVALTFLVAVLPVLPGGSAALTWATGAVPGAALLRDGHRWLAPLAMATAVLSGFALRALPRGRSDSYRLAAALFAGLLVVACLPDLGLGLAGRLRSWSYPPDYRRAQTVLNGAAAGGDASSVLVLPWSAFRDFTWTDRQTVLDPLPRMVATPAVVTHALRVSGTLLPQEGRQARAVDAALADDRLTAAELRRAGIGWVAVEHRTSGRLPKLPRSTPVLAGPDLTLYRLAADPTAARATGATLDGTRIAMAATGFAVYLGLLAAAGTVVAAAPGSLRRTTRSRSRPVPRHSRQAVRSPRPAPRSRTSPGTGRPPPRGT